MLTLSIKPGNPVARSGGQLDLDVTVGSTRPDAVTVIFHFESTHARLTPPSTQVLLQGDADGEAFRGHVVHTCTVTTDHGDLFILTATAVDGHSRTDAATAVEVTAP